MSHNNEQIFDDGKLWAFLILPFHFAFTCWQFLLVSFQNHLDLSLCFCLSASCLCLFFSILPFLHAFSFFSLIVVRDFSFYQSLSHTTITLLFCLLCKYAMLLLLSVKFPSFCHHHLCQDLFVGLFTWDAFFLFQFFYVLFHLFVSISLVYKLCDSSKYPGIHGLMCLPANMQRVTKDWVAINI